jgi:hypothetical protein
MLGIGERAAEDRTALFEERLQEREIADAELLQSKRLPLQNENWE